MRRALMRPVTLLWVAGLGLLVVATFFPSWITTSSPTNIDSSHLLGGPSLAHPLGTDELGADLFARLVYSVRLELVVSLGSTAAAVAFGIMTGTISALAHRVVAGPITGVATGVLAFPLILLGVLVVASFGASAFSLVVVLAIAFWPQVHLLVRGQIQAIAGRDFVTAARLLEVPTGLIALRHLVPNSLRPLIVLCPQLMAVAILTEAGLSYLGLGVQPPSVSWGVILLNSKDYYQQAPWYAIFAGAAITLTAFGLMLLGDRFAGDGCRFGRVRRRSRSDVSSADGTASTLLPAPAGLRADGTDVGTP